LIIILLPLCQVSAQARKIPITGIAITGNDQIPTEEIRAWFGLQEGNAFDFTSLPRHGESLLKKYAEAGYIFARIDSLVYTIAADSSQAHLALYLHEGVVVRNGIVAVTGIDSSRFESLRSRFVSRPGKTLDPEVVRLDLEDALLQLDRSGLPFARFELASISLDSLSPKQKGLGLHWRATPGPNLIIHEIQVAGNLLTREKVILREIRIKPGQPYSYQKVARIPARLMRLGFFKSVEEPVIFYTAGSDGGLLIRVEEGQSSRFDGVLGYTPGSGDEKGYFTGLIDIALGNLLGTGRALQAHWQKRDRKTQDISLGYREPWLAGLPLHVGAGFAQLIQDTTYVQRDLNLDIALPLLDNLSIIVQINRQDITPDSLGSHLLGILQSKTLNAAIGIEYDSRDDLINPRQGVYYATALQSGQKNNLGPEDLLGPEVRRNVDNKRVSLDLEFYTQLFKRQILAWALHGRQIRSNEDYVPITDQYRLGGARTLRGYREDQFRGSAVAWTSLEYRYWLGRRSRAFIFADYGYINAESSSGTSQITKLGYGFGFRLETGLGVMGVDYGLGQGDGAMAGKLHVVFINEF
jgi:outer membrane protein insertion porin family